jgi:hypothetical protein
MTWKTFTAVVLGAGLTGAAGCDAKKEESAAPPDKKKNEGHAHGTGPHGGVVFDIAGGKYHGEFKPDHVKKEATVWILGLDEQTPTPVKADTIRLVVSNTNPKIEIDLLPTDKGADGSASTFTGKHDGFGVEMEYKGTISFTVGSKPHSGDFEEPPAKK